MEPIKSFKFRIRTKGWADGYVFARDQQEAEDLIFTRDWEELINEGFDIVTKIEDIYEEAG